MKRIVELMSNTEKIINDALKIALRERDATEALELFLTHIGQKSGCERIYVVEGLWGECVSNTFEWCAPGVSKEIDNLQCVPFEAVEWWYQAFEKKNGIIIEELEDIRESEPLTYQYLYPQNVRSLIASPLVLEGQIIGFYGMDNPPKEIIAHMSQISEIIGHFITSLLERKRLIDRLEKLSFEDSLSGVRNRHALNFEIEASRLHQKVGIIYCDILGLKAVNDTQGHQAGDRLIVQASECLKAVFDVSDLYRLGGDEFLVLCYDIEEELFLKLKEKLVQEIKERQVRISLGHVWKEEVTDMDALIAEADMLMYEEKRAYYASVQKEEERR